MKIITQKIEEIPFDWNYLKSEYLYNLDYFDPNDSNDWDWFVDYVSSAFSEDELLSVKDKIIEFEKQVLIDQNNDDLDYYIGDAISKLKINNDIITKQDIIDYINKNYE